LLGLALDAAVTYRPLVLSVLLNYYCVLNADSDRYADALITYTRGAFASPVPVKLDMSAIA